MSKTFSFITIFPELIKHYLSEALLSKAQQKNILKFNVYNLREYSKNKYNSIDDAAYGGGDGMIFEIEPLVDCLQVAKAQASRDATQVIYLSPQGQRCDHKMICDLAGYDHLVFICGRYGGIDQRFISNYVDQEISIGDYVLSGGELPSLVLTEAISRQIQGVLGDHKSSEQDSFSEHLNGLLEAPQFTKPQKFLEHSVPEILTSGNHQKMIEWKNHVSVLVTLAKRPDILKNKFGIDWKLIAKYYATISGNDRKNMQIENLEDHLQQKIQSQQEKQKNV